MGTYIILKPLSFRLMKKCNGRDPNSINNFKLTPLISLLNVYNACRDDTNFIRDHITFRETMLLK